MFSSEYIIYLSVLFAQKANILHALYSGLDKASLSGTLSVFYVTLEVKINFQAPVC